MSLRQSGFRCIHVFQLLILSMTLLESLFDFAYKQSLAVFLLNFLSYRNVSLIINNSVSIAHLTFTRKLWKNHWCLFFVNKPLLTKLLRCTFYFTLINDDRAFNPIYIKFWSLACGCLFSTSRITNICHSFCSLLWSSSFASIFLLQNLNQTFFFARKARNCLIFCV